MANTIKLKRSSTANAVPSSASLEYGELALNYTDGNLFFKTAGNAVTLIASTQTANYSGNVTAGNLVVNGISSLGNVGNVSITGGTNGYVLSTNGSGGLNWVEQSGGGGTPGGGNTQIQFNDNGTFGGNANLTFNKTTNTLAVANVNVANSLAFSSLAGGNISFVAANTAANVAFIVPVTSGTSKQVLGVIDQGTQQLGWKTVPTYYISVGLRAGGSYLAPPAPVLRVYPVRLRDNSFINVATTQ